MIEYLPAGHHTFLGWLVGKIAKYHIFALVETSYPQWIYVDNGLNGLLATSLDDEKIAELERRIDIVDEVTVLVPYKRPPKSFTLLEPLNCVTIVKRLVHMNKFWVITPLQLMKELRANGGNPAN